MSLLSEEEVALNCGEPNILRSPSSSGNNKEEHNAAKKENMLVFFEDSLNPIPDILIDDGFPQGHLAFVVLQHLLEVFSGNPLSIWKEHLLELCFLWF